MSAPSNGKTSFFTASMCSTRTTFAKTDPVYEHELAANDQNAIEILKGISPVAWRNVNLIGNFDFTTGTSPVDIEALARKTHKKASKAAPFFCKFLVLNKLNFTKRTPLR